MNKRLSAFMIMFSLFFLSTYSFAFMEGESEGESELDQIENTTLEEKWDEAFPVVAGHSTLPLILGDITVGALGAFFAKYYLNSSLIHEAQYFFSRSDPKIFLLEKNIQEYLDEINNLTQDAALEGEELIKLRKKLIRLDELMSERDQHISLLVRHYDQSLGLNGKKLPVNEYLSWKILKKKLHEHKVAGSVFVVLSSYHFVEAGLRAYIVRNENRETGFFPLMKSGYVFASHGMQLIQLKVQGI